MRRLFAVCFAVALLAGCGGGDPAGTSAAASAATSTPAASAEPIAPCVDPQDPDLAAVHLQPKAGVEVDAVLAGTGSTGIVFSNMSGETLCGWLPTALAHVRKGYRVALYEYSADQSPDADLAVVADELRRRGATRIALVGASMGGTTSVVAANAVKAAAVFVLSAPGAYSGMDAVGAVSRVAVPSWFGVGEQDTEFVPSARDLYKHSAAPRKQLKILPTGAHGTALLGGTVDTMLADFLRTNAPAA